MNQTKEPGTVALVGAGPGDPGLLTVKGRNLLERADVVVYDRLIGIELLQLCRDDAELVFVGKEAARHALPQDEINALLVQRALQGKQVCRLKGGDPFVFGRGGEEALYCRAHGVPFVVVPGVSSSIAAPAYAGIPVTQREVATSFAVVTGHTKDSDAPPADLPVADTLVFLMGVSALPTIVKQLLERGEEPGLPVALVRWGTTVQQQVVTGTLATIEDEVARAKVLPPALIVVGRVVALREQLRWFDNRALWGQSIVVTRAREQASGLVEDLEARGARVVQCPTIGIEEPVSHEAVDKAIAELSSFHWVVFTSCNGVTRFWQRMREQGLDARAFGRVLIAAIGPATVAALHDIGVHADFVPRSSISEEVARGMAELGIVGQEVLVARAEATREALEPALQAAGARVTAVPCYRAVPLAENAAQVREALQVGAINWVTFTSSSTVRNFMDAVGSEVVLAARDSFRVACIGPITAATAAACGLVPEVTAAAASVGSLADAIELFVRQSSNPTENTQ